MTKICSKCKIEKSLNAFHSGRKRCKICREDYLTNYRNKNRQKTRDYKNKWKLKNPDKVKSASLKSDYGINLEQYNNLLNKQNNACAICKKNKDILDKALAVDHCHKTNLIRGLLCNICNRVLGLLLDNPDLFRSAAEYLEQANEKKKKTKKPYIPPEKPIREPDHISKRGVHYYWSPEWVRGTDSLNSNFGRIRALKEDGTVNLYMQSKDGNLSYIQGSIQKEFKDWHENRKIDYFFLASDPDELDDIILNGQ